MTLNQANRRARRHAGRIARPEQQSYGLNPELRVLLDSMSSGVALVDASGRFTYVNQQFLTMFGLSVNARIPNLNDTDWSAWEFFDSDGHPLPVDERPARKAASARQPVRSQLVGVRSPSAGGNLTWMQVSAVPIFGPCGAIKYLICTYNEVTEHRRVEQALRESEARFQSVLESSRDCIYRLNVQTNDYVYMSPTSGEKLGFSPEELMALDSKAPSSLIHPDDLPALRAAIATAESTGKAECEYRQRAKDGTYHWLSNRMSVIKDRAGRPLYRDGTLRDITEAKRAEEALGDHVGAQRDSTERKRAAEALERILAEGQRIAHLGSFEYVVDTRATIWSDEEYRIYGLDPAGPSPAYEDMLARSIHPDDAARVDETLAKALESRSMLEIEHRIVRPDGSVRWLYNRAHPYFDEKGRLVRYVGATLDVTERRQADEALRQSLAEREAALAKAEEGTRTLQTLMDNVPEGITIADASVTIRMVSKFGQELIGGPHNLPAEDVARRWKVYRADGQTEMAFHDLPLTRAVELGENVRDAELIQIASDGTRLNLLCNAAPIRNRQGRITGGVVVWRDITERKRQEEAVRHNEAKLRAVFRALVEGVVFLDRKGVPEEINEAVKTRYGHTLSDPRAPELDPRQGIVRPDGSPFPAEEQPIMVALRTGQAVFDVEMGVPTSAGDIRWRLVNAQPAYDDRGTLLGAVASFFDITDRKKADEALRRANERLVEADRRKNEFLAVLSHELRNPLTPIRNSVHIMVRASPGGEQWQRALVVIDRQVTHMARLIDDLLDVTRISRGKVRLQRESLELNGIVRGTGEDHRELFRKNGIDLQVNVADTPIRALVDRTRLDQIIGNLLQNAAKFTPRGGSVRLSLQLSPDREAMIQVRDNGPGIESRLLGRLFEPFVQADQDLDRSRGGLGLGLALVKGLVELHGGTVTASSEGRGKGATFTVLLPVEASASAESQRSPVSSDIRSRSKRILVIEDNEDVAMSLKELLELSGHVVDVALTGPEGIRKARESPPDVVLCDIGLPGTDGYGVVRALRSYPACRSASMVALSGYALQEDVEKSLAAGFDCHLAKPPEMAELERTVANAPRRH